MSSRWMASLILIEKIFCTFFINSNDDVDFDRGNYSAIYRIHNTLHYVNGYYFWLLKYFSVFPFWLSKIFFTFITSALLITALIFCAFSSLLFSSCFSAFFTFVWFSTNMNSLPMVYVSDRVKVCPHSSHLYCFSPL